MKKKKKKEKAIEKSSLSLDIVDSSLVQDFWCVDRGKGNVRIVIGGHLNGEVLFLQSSHFITITIHSTQANKNGNISEAEKAAVSVSREA